MQPCHLKIDKQNFFYESLRTLTLTSTHQHLSLWIHARSPTPMGTYKRMSRQVLKIDEVGIGFSLLIGMPPTANKITLAKSWNRSRKIRASVPSVGLKLGWATLSLQQPITSCALSSNILKRGYAELCMPTNSYDLIHLKWKIMLCQNRHNKSYLFWTNLTYLNWYQILSSL